MKATAVLVATLATAAAFAPAPAGRAGTQLQAEKKPFFESVFGMDLFAPNPGVNEYGARAKKGVKVGKLGAKSYVPAGLSKAQYEKIRAEEQAKKEANYARNKAKAGKFIDFTEWYAKRGTELTQGWVNSVTKGHNMVKTKYDWSGKKDEQKTYDGRA